MALGDPYLTVDDLKARLQITDAADDARLAAVILAAGQQIDAWAGRTFNNTGAPTARVLTPHAYDVLSLQDAVSVSEIAGDIALNRTYTDVWDPQDYDLYPYEATELGQPYTEIRTTWRTRRVFILLARSVRVTAVWGWPAVPPAIVEATSLQANRLYKRATAPFGIAGSPQLGQMLTITRMDPDVLALVNPFRVVGF